MYSVTEIGVWLSETMLVSVSLDYQYTTLFCLFLYATIIVSHWPVFSLVANNLIIHDMLVPASKFIDH